MVLLIITIILTIIIAAVIIIVAHIQEFSKFFTFLALALPILVIPCGSVTKVGANEVGIIYDEIHGGIQSNRTYGEGVHFKSIFEKVIKISTINRETSLVTTGQTSDGQYVTFELSIIYKIETENAGTFYKATGNTDITEEAMSTIVKSTLQRETIKYNIFALLSEELENARIGFQTSLTTNLLDKYSITVVATSFDDVDGGSEVEQILKDLAKAEQEIEIARKAAEARLIAAQAEADAQVILADAAAYAVSIMGIAQGEAANAYIDQIMKLIDTLYLEMGPDGANTMTYAECADLILGVIFYNTWDGALPTVLTSDSLSALIGALIG